MSPDAWEHPQGNIYEYTVVEDYTHTLRTSDNLMDALLNASDSLTIRVWPGYGHYKEKRKRAWSKWRF